MSLPDKAIAKALDRIHTEEAGIRAPCRWYYNGKTDVYSCEHGSVGGKQVIEESKLWPERVWNAE